MGRAATRPAGGRAQTEHLRTRVTEDHEVFCAAVTAWTRLREQWLLQTKRSVLPSRLKELEHGLRQRYRRMRLLREQLG